MNNFTSNSSTSQNCFLNIKNELIQLKFFLVKLLMCRFVAFSRVLALILWIFILFKIQTRLMQAFFFPYCKSLLKFTVWIRQIGWWFFLVTQSKKKLFSFGVAVHRSINPLRWWVLSIKNGTFYGISTRTPLKTIARDPFKIVHSHFNLHFNPSNCRKFFCVCVYHFNLFSKH